MSTTEKISIYNGQGNEKVGLYNELIARPMRCMNGATGDLELVDWIAGEAGDTVYDRTSGAVWYDRCPDHPAELGALVAGICARINNNRAEESYGNVILPGVLPALEADDSQNDDYANRDAAVKLGLSPCLNSSGTVLLQNVCTFFRSPAIPQASNAYRSYRNVSIIQNLLYNAKLLFATSKWQGVTIVADVSKVTNATSKAKVRDRDAAVDDVVGLVTSFETRAWIYEAKYTLDRLKADPSLISLRSAGNGFNVTLPVLLSGEGGIYNTLVQADASLSVVLGY
jgi:hypothetical protein